jgi:two-component system phosphate regulon sensor histidine kinase PhoR
VDWILVIGVVGLALALAAALLVMRRRADEVDVLHAELARAHEAALADAAAAAAAARPVTDPVIELLPVGVLHLGAERRIDRANERAHALLDTRPGRLVGRTLMEAFLDAHAEALIGSVPAGGTATGEVRMGAGDPRIVVLRVHRPVDDGTYVVLEDATELRRLQQIRSEFIDNLSHELRTPLTTVSLLAETLARDADSADVPERMRERITKIEVETGHLVQMVGELLDLARIEGGSKVSLDDDVDLGRLAESSVERLRLFADRNGVTLVVDAEPGLPTVRGDEARLGQVFVNLVHNAIKFSPDGGEVRVTVRGGTNELVVTVADHGIGIAKADRARIFERFYKADRARLRGGGTGLGLSIARHVVEGHGGRIRVESEEGRGSAFTFTIPVVRSVDGRSPSSAATDAPSDAPSDAAPAGAPS